MTSFIGYMYINNTVIKLTIYSNSHMRIVWQIKDMISTWLYVLSIIQDSGAYKD